MENSNQKVFVVFNPKAGKEDQADEVRAALASHFTAPAVDSPKSMRRRAKRMRMSRRSVVRRANEAPIS